MGDALTFAAAAQATEFFKALARHRRRRVGWTAADPRHGAGRRALRAGRAGRLDRLDPGPPGRR